MPSGDRVITVSRTHLIRISYLVLFSVFSTAGLLVFLGRTPPGWVPEPLQYLAFDVQLAASPQFKKIVSISNGFPANVRAYHDNAGEEVAFFSGNLLIAGTLYLPDHENEYPGIVLIHGSTPEGRKLGLYRILGRELADRGYAVLSIDLRGYGESDDPDPLDELSAFDFPSDITHAASYLASLENVQNDEVFVIGHSAGADQAIRAGIVDERIVKIIALGPSRRIEERYGDVNKPEFKYFKRRVERYMALPEPIPEDVFQELTEQMNIEAYVGYFSNPAHKPLLLIDGELEDPADIQFLNQFYERLDEPKNYLTLENSDHYANTSNWGPFVVYDENVISNLVDEIDRWISE